MEAKHHEYVEGIAPGKQFLTIKQLTDAGFGSRTSLYRAMKAGKLPAYKQGERVLIPRQAFEEYLDSIAFAKAGE